ncbi:MAG: hypothetical protein J7456_16515 [Chloroflexus sp.]|nr:hypothetical protein [Chloroflexus sp.]
MIDPVIGEQRSTAADGFGATHGDRMTIVPIVPIPSSVSIGPTDGRDERTGRNGRNRRDEWTGWTVGAKKFFAPTVPRRHRPSLTSALHPLRHHF